MSEDYINITIHSEQLSSLLGALRNMGQIQRTLYKDFMPDLSARPNAFGLTQEQLTKVAQISGDACTSLAKYYEEQRPGSLTYAELVDDLNREYEVRARVLMKEIPDAELLLCEQIAKAKDIMRNVAHETIPEMLRIVAKVEAFEEMEARQEVERDNMPTKRVIIGVENVNALLTEFVRSIDGIQLVASEKASVVCQEYPDLAEHVGQIKVESYYNIVAKALSTYKAELENELPVNHMVFYEQAEKRLNALLDEGYDEWVDANHSLKRNAEESRDELDSLLKHSLQSSWNDSIELMDLKSAGRG